LDGGGELQKNTPFKYEKIRQPDDTSSG